MKQIIKHFPKNLRKFCVRCNKEQLVYFSEGNLKGYCKTCGLEIYSLKQYLSERTK
jgi:transcription elongation factor Elf1